MKMTPGERYGRLVTVRPDAVFKKQYICLCDCGTEKSIWISALRGGLTKSCGCLVRESNAARNKARTVHGARNTPTHRSWISMRNRCNNPNNPGYEYYGGRGITVCERWSSYTNFLEDMGERPKGTSLDRRDNNKGYEPGNCRWASRVVQENNKSTNRILTVDGQSMTVAEWARHLGVNKASLKNRLHLGWSDERAVKEPFRKRTNK